MRKALGVLGLAIALLAIAVPAVAQENFGAAIIRGEGLGWVWEWDGEDLLVGMSTFSAFGCGDDVVVGLPYQIVIPPVGSPHLSQNGPLFARVWYGTPDDIFTDDDLNFEFICNEQPIAEGIIRAHFMDNDLEVAGPGANVWGHVFNGTLYDLDGLCIGGMVELKVLHKWRIPPGGNINSEAIPRVFVGPELSCPE